MTDLPTSDKTLDSSISTPPDQPPPPPPSLTRNLSSSKLNAKAPEFVPMKTQSPPPSSLTAADPRIIIVPPPPPPPPTVVHVYPPSPLPVPVPVRAPAPFPPHLHHHLLDKDQGSVLSSRSNNNNHNNNNNHTINSNNYNGLSDETTQKLINQVEYYFSDVNLATTEHLIRFIFKDPEGFVPISVVASFKKIKALISSNSQLAAVLRDSTKLVVSEDGKKVKRLHALTSSDMEELQARIVVTENLPEDHCHQNLMKIFSAVGSVKSIRTCQPQPSNNVSSASRSSKNDNMPYSNKLHAFVEYASVELAEKAIAELNDEDSWRNGLRVRPLPKQVMKPAQGRTKKSGNESDNCEEEDVSTSDLNQNEKQSEGLTAEPDVHSHEQGEDQNLEKEGGQKKSRNRTRGKGRGRGYNNNHHHYQTSRGSHVGGPSMSSTPNGDQLVKQQPPGPRMPDGTRGFSMGRGRPITVNTA